MELGEKCQGKLNKPKNWFLGDYKETYEFHLKNFVFYTEFINYYKTIDV